MDKPRKKIVRIIARLNVGGPAVHCTLLSKQLKNHGYDTILVTGNVDPSEASYEEVYQVSPEGYELVRLKKLGRFLSFIGDFRSFIDLVLLLRREKPDIVHTHTAKAGMLGRAAAAIAGTPVVVHTFHGHVLSGYFSPFFSKLVTYLERALATRTTAIVTLSPGLKKELSEKFRLAPASRFRVIPLGRDLGSFFTAKTHQGELRKELGISDPNLVLFGIVGRLVPIKAHSLLLEACAALKTSTPWKLCIAGEGPLAEELAEKTRQLGLSDRVHFLGWRADLPRIYSDLDFMVLCSKNEGTPLSIIESFAAGCPVIATTVGGVPDMFQPLEEKQNDTSLSFQKEGILLPSGDGKLLTDAITAFIDNAALRKSCSKEALHASQKYTDTNLVANVASLYKELLAGAV